MTAGRPMEKKMKATVCELPNNWTREDTRWHEMIAHLASEKSDLLVLPEMPFYTWITRSDHVDIAQWDLAVQAHETWCRRLEELPVPMVAASRPVTLNGRRLNQGFIWSRQDGVLPCHEKFYLPDEPGYFEATWYHRGNGRFRAVRVNGSSIGFMICTDLWFTDRAREYKDQEVDILVCPRATPASREDIWVPGGRAAAIVGGAFCLSSNYNGPNVPGEDFGGAGWVIEPERGAVQGLTDQRQWILTLDIDPGKARAAKKTYPRYVKE
jgi:N-carbamoylputrescine amidase